MKKQLLLVSLLCAFLVGCSDTNKDPYADFRDQTSKAIFTEGEAFLADEHYGEAIKRFEALDAIYPFGPYARQGQLDIIYAYYKNDDEPSAVAAVNRYIHLYPRGPNTDYAYYMRGIMGFEEGLSWLQKKWGVDPAPRDVATIRQSFISFAAIVHSFPKSPYAKDSLVRMKYIRNIMARRELQIAEFYLQKRAYVAAANRASYVVQHFEGAPSVIGALAVMVKAYRALNLDEMAGSTYTVLQVSYPDAPETKALQKNNV